MKKQQKKPSKTVQGLENQSMPVQGGRISWNRKPMTQIVPNKKAEQRRAWCRKGTDDGAIFLFDAHFSQQAA